LSAELEAAAADSTPHLVGKPKPPPPHGVHCANCGAVLEGPYCHVCGQEYDRHKRSIVHLIWEAIEGLFHLDGRLSRTLPALFFRPGALAKDYMEGRIARHVPPFRTFLVALLLFIFAAEHAIHKITEETEHKAHERAAELATPQGRAAEAALLRTEAADTKKEALADAVKDRAEDLKDPDEDKAKVEARYAKAITSIEAHYAASLDKADKLTRGEQVNLSYNGVGILGSEEARAATLKAIDASGTVGAGAEKNADWLKQGLKKAVANPEYYLTVMFAWGHRLAVLLLPIVGLSLALVYVNKRRFYIYDHLLVAMNLLSFAFLTNALGFVLPMPWQAIWFGVVALWTPINLFQTLRGAYGSGVVGATIKTLIVWFSTVLAFTLLVTGLMIFALGQL
jgi:hypothetical protein